MNRLIYILPLLLFAGLAAYFATPILQGKNPHTLPSAMIDKPAPLWPLEPLLSSKPGLMQIAAAKTVPLYGVNYKDAPEAAVNWLAQLGDPFERIGRDDDGRTGIEWGVYGLPETYVVDRAGRIQYRHVGPLSRQTFEEMIMPLVIRLREQNE